MGFPVAQVGRYPKPKDLLGKLLFGAGSVLRGVGVALDGLGAAVQGPYGVQQERECLVCRLGTSIGVLVAQGCQCVGVAAALR